MNDEGTAWEIDTIRAFFHEDLAETILLVPISRLGGDDFVSWKHDKQGQYTVRSAYNLARTSSFFSEHTLAGRGSGSDRSGKEKLWKYVWKIQDPNKMKIVLWRMIHDCLPTGHQLVTHHIPANDQCMFCGQMEKVEHLFLLCPYARAVWDAVKETYYLRLYRRSIVSFKQWCFEFW
jgi:hypothetical protein